MKKAAIFCLAITLLLSLCGCGKADISQYGDEQILVTGLLDEDFYITPNELAEFDCISDKAVGKSQKAGTVEAYGPTLDTFLNSYGVSTDELYSIKFIAKDGYVVTLGKLTWDKYNVILSVAAGSKPLNDYHQPLRLVIPGGDSGNWTYGVTEIHITYK